MPSIATPVKHARTQYYNSVASANALLDTSKSFIALNRITQVYGQEIIEDHRQNKSTTNSIGCWLSTNRPNHPNVYHQVNVRKSVSRLDNKPIGGKPPWLHQVAVIADGRLDQLREAGTTKLYNCQCSHLSHKGACFNPAHVAVETGQHNRWRNT
jgi:Zinc-binding loop region of homing endonuclease